MVIGDHDRGGVPAVGEGLCGIWRKKMGWREREFIFLAFGGCGYG